MTLSLSTIRRRKSPLHLLPALSACLGLSLSAWADAIPTDATSESGKPPHDDYSKLTDRDFGSGSFVVFAKGGNAHATLDLGSVQPVDRLVIVGRPMAGVPSVSSCRIELSDDGETWNEVAEVDNAQAVSTLAGTPRNSGGTLAIGFPPQNARYVRLFLTDPAKSEQIGELMVFHKNGPRVSLVDRGAQFNMTAEGLTEKYPFYLVDGISDDLTRFVLYSGSASGPVTGDFTLRLESPEYAEGWNKVVLSGRGTQPVASNPPTVTISVANSLDGPFVAVHTESFPPSNRPWRHEIELPGARTEKYVKVAWASDEKTETSLNVQFTEVDVVPATSKP